MTEESDRTSIASSIPVSKRRFILRAGLATVIGSFGLVILLAMSQLLAEVSESGETNDVFTEAAELPPSLIDAVVWLPDNEQSPRPLEPLTRTDVAATWLRAWAQIAIVAETGETEGIDIYFSNSAREAILASVEGWQDLPVHQIGHELYLSFYSEDGQVIGLTATKANLLRTEIVGDQKEYFNAQESYEAVLILEDGNWRVQHWVRRSATGRWPSGPLPSATDGIKEGLAGPTITLFEADSSDRHGEHEADDAELLTNELETDDLATDSASGDDLGVDLAILEAELEAVVASGERSVRLDLDSELFDSEPIADKDLALLEGFLDLAAQNGLSVVPSFFHGETPHLPSRWDADVRRLESFVAVLAGHEAVALYELAHKPDLAVGDGVDTRLVDAWISHIGHAVHEFDSSTPMLITWSNREVAGNAKLYADLVAFGYPNSSLDHPEIVGTFTVDEVPHVIVKSTESAGELPDATVPFMTRPLVRLAVVAVLGIGFIFALFFVSRKLLSVVVARRKRSGS